jgi:hypothetical protein
MAPGPAAYPSAVGLEAKKVADEVFDIIATKHEIGHRKMFGSQEYT